MCLEHVLGKWASNTKHPRCRSKTSKIIRKCWVSNTRLWIFAWKHKKQFFTPWLRLEFWGVDSAQDFARIGCAFFLEWFGKVLKSASGEIFEGLGQHFGLGSFLGRKNGPEKDGFVEEWFCGGVLGESFLPKWILWSLGAIWAGYFGPKPR